MRTLITVLFVSVFFVGCATHVVQPGTTTTTTTVVEKKDSGETKTTTTVVKEHSTPVLPITTYVAPVVPMCNGPWGPAPCVYPVYPIWGPSIYLRWGGGGGHRGHWR